MQKTSAMKSAVLVKPALHYPLIWNQLHTLFYKERFFQIILNAALLLLDDNVDEENKKFSNSKNSASGCCLAFAWFFAKFNLMLLIKVLLIKKCLVVPALLIETSRLQHSSITRFFYKQNFFSTQPRCRLTISWIELQMLLGYCLIHITIIIRGDSRAAATSKMECFVIIVNGLVNYYQKALHLGCCSSHRSTSDYIETHVMFSIFVSMSRSGSIHFVCIWSFWVFVIVKIK